MADEQTAIVESNDKKQDAVMIDGTLDEKCIQSLKTSLPSNRGKLDRATIGCIQENVAHGISMMSQCLYQGIPPTTAYQWFTQGQEEVEKLSDEDIMNAENGAEDLVSLKGLFYLRVSKAHSDCVIEIHNMLYDRAFESGKEWIATYILERQEPEKYNLKYKVQQEVNANVSANVVEFKFMDGLQMRDPEDQKFITDQVDQLKEKYKSTDIVVDQEYEISEENENVE